MKLTEWMLQKTINGSTNLQVTIIVICLIISSYITVNTFCKLIKNYKRRNSYE